MPDTFCSPCIPMRGWGAGKGDLLRHWLARCRISRVLGKKRNRRPPAKSKCTKPVYTGANADHKTSTCKAPAAKHSVAPKVAEPVATMARQRALGDNRVSAGTHRARHRSRAAERESLLPARRTVPRSQRSCPGQATRQRIGPLRLWRIIGLNPGLGSKLGPGYTPPSATISSSECTTLIAA
jgi:hypothetical protein